MPPTLRFRRRLTFSELPKDCSVSRVAVDWNGGPLVLVQEGKEPYPVGSGATNEERMMWLRTRPKGHHLVYWDGNSQRTLAFENATGILTAHVQPFEGGWLLGQGRGGRADVYDETGKHKRVMDLGDASKDLQTTADGQIWVSYFDEGVYGGGIGGQNGLVCFDASGRPTFKYFQFAEENGLPFIDDCYAMNVPANDEIWISYYSAFALVALKRFQLQQVWRDFGCIGKAFGIFGDAVIFPKCYEKESQLLKKSFLDSSGVSPVEAIDGQGVPIAKPFRASARGSNLYLWNSAALFELEIPSTE